MYLRSHFLNGAPVFIFACPLGVRVRKRKKKEEGEEKKEEREWRHRFVS
jgi:hypothetical protein